MKRLMSMILILSMLVSLCAIPAQAEKPVVLLEAERIAADKLPEGNLIYMGTASTAIKEEDAVYSVTVYREGDLSAEACVDIHTLDMTAVYGEDYILLGDDVEETGNGVSLLEESVKAELEAREDDPADEESAEEIESEAVNTEPSEPLAPEIYQAVVDELVPEAMQSVQYSSTSTVTFAPGENEKQVKFQIFNDNDSEGNEGFSLLLVNPQGAELHLVTSLSVTIEDDEPIERGEVSFTKKSFKSKDGIATIKLERKGGEHTLCDVRIMSSGDTAVADVNYEEYNQLISFMPYEMEKEIEIPVTGEGEFKLLMREFSGCEEGKHTETLVKIRPEDNDADVDGDISLMANEEGDFSIEIKDKDYNVEYQMPGNEAHGASQGTILAEGYDMPPEVGIYYFSTDKNKGGLWKYGQYSGSKPWGCGVRHSDYQMDTDIRSMDAGSHYGRLQYYHTTTTKHGQSYTTASGIPSVYYQCLIPDWESTSGFGGGQLARFKVNSKTSDVDGSFGRSQDKGAIKLMDGANEYNGDLSLGVYSVDEETHKTPKSYVRFYGIAAMYKKFTVQVMPVAEKTYKVGKSDTVSAEPLQVMLNSGAERIGEKARDFWANVDPNKSNIVFTIDNSDINGRNDKFGYVTGYKIELNPGTTADKKTLNYPGDFANYLRKMEGKSLSSEVQFTTDNVEKELKKIEGENAHLDIIPVDKYFISWIESVQEKVVNDGHGYRQILQITPQVSYADVNVEVMPSVGDSTGHFNDPALASGTKAVYHAGDTIDLSATADKAGYHVVGYQVSEDGGVKYNTIANTTSLFLLPNKSYKVRPIIAENTNRIEVKFVNGAENYLEVQGLITDKDLADCTDDNLVKELQGKYVLNANPSEASLENKIAPVAGEIYTLSIISKENGSAVYRPVIKQGNDTFKTNVYHTVGAENTVDNVITIDYEKVEKKSLDKFNVAGRVVSASAPIRSNGLEVKKLPLVGYTVAAGMGTQSKNKGGSTEYLADTASSSTSEEGTYSLLDISGQEGDLITVYVSNGVTNGQIEKVRLTKQTGKDGKVYSVDSGNIEIKYPYGAPRVTAIMYNYEKTSNNANADNTLNQIRIMEDNLVITAVVDKCGREIKEAVFTVRTVTGDVSEYKAQAQSEGSNIFVCKIDKMLENLYAGDSVSVRLVDKEKKSFQNGGDMEVVYPEVDTGLTFYTAYELAVPQSYEFENSPEINIPLIGSATGNNTSGVLNFSKTKWANDTGYTISVNAAAAFKGMPTMTNEQKVGVFKKFHTAAQEAPATKKNAMQVLNETYPDGCPHRGQYGPDEEDKLKADTEDYIKNFKDAKNPMSGFNNQFLSVNAALVIAFDFVKTPEGDYVFACGTVAIGGGVNFNKTMYTVVSTVPVFLNIQAGIQVNSVTSYVTDDGKNLMTAAEFESVGGNIANRLKGTEEKLSVVISGKVQVGVGMCGVLSARGYASLTLQFDIYCVSGTGGALLTIAGGVGFDILIMSINIDIAKYTQGWGTLEQAAEGDFFNGMLTLSNDDGLEEHKYSIGSADFSAFGKNDDLSVMSVPTAVSCDVLQENATERTRPNIIPLDESGTKKMIIFIGNGMGIEGSTRDENNASTLFYSIYDGKEWSKPPKPVADDNTFDSTPIMKKIGKKVVIAWTDANSPFEVTDTNKECLEKFGISCAVYDIETGDMSEESTITDDGYFNLSPQINVDNNIAYVSYMKRDLSNLSNSNSDLIDFSLSTTQMAYRSCALDAPDNISEEKLIEIPHEGDKYPLVMDYHAAITNVGGDSYMLSTYTIDSDEDLTTGNDRELYFGVYNLTTDKQYYHVKITDNDVAESAPKLTEVDGDVYMTWLSNGYMFNMTNVSEIMEAIFAPVSPVDETNTAMFDAETVKSAYSESAMDNPNDSSKKEWYKKTAAELGMDEEIYNDSIYGEVARGFSRMASANFQGNDDLQTSVGDYIVTSNGDDIYIYYTELSDDPKSAGVEIFGVKYRINRNEEDTGDIQWGFGKAVQITDFGMVIDELDLFMTKDNKISAVSNFYEQWVDENDPVEPIKYSENKLVEIEFEPANSLGIEGDRINFPARIYPGRSDLLSIGIENAGLIDAMGYTLKVKDNRGNEIYNATSDTIIEAGDSIDLEIPWTVPENVEGLEITAEVVETGVENSVPEIVTKAVPYETMLEVSDVRIDEREDGYHITGVVANNGSKASGDVKVTLSVDGKEENVKYESTVSALSGGDKVNIEMPFVPEVDEFNHLGYMDLTVTAFDGDKKATAHTGFNSSKPMIAQINDGAESVSLEGENAEIKLTALAAPWSSYAGEAEFTSADNGIAVVDDEGNVTPTGNGTTTVTVYYPKYGLSDEISVIVSGIEDENNDEDDKPSSRPSGGSSGRPSTNTGKPEWVNPFIDVSEGDWFYDVVKTANQKGLMKGVSETEFAPEESVTRGMFVTVLHRVEGEPEAEKSVFTDVPVGEYYEKAVDWASASGVVNGVSETEFAPDELITREQMAAMLYRYAQYKGMDVVVMTENLNQFEDSAEISAYAVSALNWTVETGIMSGKGNGILDPASDATRAETAAVLVRFLNII